MHAAVGVCSWKYSVGLGPGVLVTGGVGSRVCMTPRGRVGLVSC